MDYYAQHPAGIYKVAFGVLIFFNLASLASLLSPQCSFSLAHAFSLCLLPSLSVLLLNPVILSISLSSLQTLTLPLCLPANPPRRPLALLPFPSLTLSRYLSLVPLLRFFSFFSPSKSLFLQC